MNMSRKIARNLPRIFERTDNGIARIICTAITNYYTEDYQTDEGLDMTHQGWVEITQRPAML